MPFAVNPCFHCGPVRDPAYYFGRAREAVYIAELLRTGQLPFTGDHPAAVLMAHLQPRRFASALPEPAAQTLLCALAKDPDERYRRVAEFGEALKAALG